MKTMYINVPFMKRLAKLCFMLAIYCLTPVFLVHQVAAQVKSTASDNQLSLRVSDNTLYFNVPKGGSEVNAMLVNTQGKSTVLTSKIFSEGDQQLSLTDGARQSSGVYILHVIVGNKKASLKIINADGTFLPSATQMQSLTIYENRTGKTGVNKKSIKEARLDNTENAFPVYIQTNTNYLWQTDGFSGTNLGIGMAAGTSPSAAWGSNGESNVFLQANTGELWQWTAASGGANLGLGMAPGTSPTAVLTPNGINVFLQANTGELWQWTAASGGTNLGIGMAPGTSPVAVTDAQGTVHVYCQANTGNLWQWTPSGGSDLQIGMADNTSPSAVSNTSGVYAYVQANTGNLWQWTPSGGSDLQIGMAANTSPSAVSNSTGGVVVYVQANTGNMWQWTPSGGSDLQLGMAGNTSPAAIATPTGINVFAHVNTGNLWQWNSSSGGQDLQLGMADNTSPCVTNGDAYGAMFILYPTEYDAVQAAVGKVWNNSIDEHLEYGGVVYKVQGTDLYGYVSIKGNTHDITTNGYYPSVSEVTGYWHTHPNRESAGASPADLLNLLDEIKKGKACYVIVYSQDQRNTPKITRFAQGTGQTKSDRKYPEEFLNAATAVARTFVLDSRSNQTFAIELDDFSKSSVIKGTAGPVKFGYNINNNSFSTGVGPVSVSTNGNVTFTIGGQFGPLAVSGAGTVNVPALLQGRWAEILSLSAYRGYGFGFELLGIGFGGSAGEVGTINFKEEGPGNNWGDIIRP